MKRITCIGLLLALGACTPAEPEADNVGSWVGTITTEGDVTTVINESGSVWGGTAKLVEEASIGVEAGADEYMFGQIDSVYATDERIYVVDSQVPAVRVYDHDGAFVRNIGGGGQGPGEYTFPTIVTVDKQGRVFVVANMRRINVYDATGEPTETWPLSDFFCCVWPMYPLADGTYVVDANGAFGTVVETARLLNLEGTGFPELIVVGIGYPLGYFRNTLLERVVDLSPTEDRGQEGDSGGGPDFLRFLVQELAPRIDAEHRADESDRAIYGHSLGGLFAVYALLESDGAFRRVVAGSPALWWGDAAIFDVEAAVASSGVELTGRIFVAAGERETPELTPGSPPYVDDVHRLVTTLSERAHPDLDIEAHIFARETHFTVVAPIISRGLRYVYGER